VTRVGLIPHRDKDFARDLAEHAAAWLEDHGAAVELAKPDADRIGRPELAVDAATFPDGLDVVISLGGDGSMLRAIDQSYDAGVAGTGRERRPDGLSHRGRARRPRCRARPPPAGDYRIDERMVLGHASSRPGPRRPLVRTQRGGAREDAHRRTWRGSRSTSTARSSPRTRPTA
jgi:NAD+ kinase